MAGTFEHQGGWVDQPAAGIKNFNGQDVADARFKALWQAGTNFKINTMAVIHRNSGHLASGFTGWDSLDKAVPR